MSTRPVLILNPRNDAAFVEYAESLVNDSTDAASLQARLRERYPLATVRPRDLSSERTSIWYVYRDGHWVPSPGVEES